MQGQKAGELHEAQSADHATNEVGLWCSWLGKLRPGAVVASRDQPSAAGC